MAPASTARRMSRVGVVGGQHQHRARRGASAHDLGRWPSAPSMPGIRRSIRTTSGRSSPARRDGASAPSRPRRRRRGRARRRAAPRMPVAHDGVVVGEHDADRGGRSVAARSRQASPSRVVPRPGSLSTSDVAADLASTRARMPRSPKPVGAAGRVEARPSSVTSSTMPVVAAAAPRRSTASASACRRTLVSASWRPAAATTSTSRASRSRGAAVDLDGRRRSRSRRRSARSAGAARPARVESVQRGRCRAPRPGAGLGQVLPGGALDRPRAWPGPASAAPRVERASAAWASMTMLVKPCARVSWISLARGAPARPSTPACVVRRRPARPGWPPARRSGRPARRSAR